MSFTYLDITSYGAYTEAWHWRHEYASGLPFHPGVDLMVVGVEYLTTKPVIWWRWYNPDTSTWSSFSVGGISGGTYIQLSSVDESSVSDPHGIDGYGEAYVDVNHPEYLAISIETQWRYSTVTKISEDPNVFVGTDYVIPEFSGTLGSFDLPKFFVTADAGVATFSIADGTPVNPGTTYTLTITFNAGSVLDEMTLNTVARANGYSFVTTAQDYYVVITTRPASKYIVAKDANTDTVDPANNDLVVVGVEKTIHAVPLTGYVIDSVKLDSSEVGNDYKLTPIDKDYNIDVTTTPEMIGVTCNIQYWKTDCLPKNSLNFVGLDTSGQPQSDGLQVTMGGSVYYSGSPPAVCISETPVAELGEDVEYGSSFGVWAVAHDVRTRLVSLTVNGNDYVSNPSGGALPNQFVYCGSGVAGRPLNSGGLFFDVPGTAVSISAVFASDMVCVNRLPQLPKSGPVPPAPPAPGQPYPNPFPDPTAPNPFPIPVPGDTYPIPGFIPDGPEEGNPGDIPGGPGDDGGGGGGSTGGGGPDGIGSPFGTPESVKKVDQIGETSPRGLIIRWRNDAGKWSKEHVIDLGTIGQTNLFKQICPMGDYVTRQWEIIHIDAIPFAVVYLEEEVEKRSE